MKHIWEAVGAVLITALMVKLLFDMIKPFAIWLVIGVIIVALLHRAYNQHRNW